MVLSSEGTRSLTSMVPSATRPSSPYRSEPILDETYGSGYVRTLALRLERGGDEQPAIEPYRPGRLHHLHVITGSLITGPISDPVDLAAGDFARFPGDVPHRHICLSDRVTAHMVTTLPRPLSVAMKKSPLVAKWRSPLVAR